MKVKRVILLVLVLYVWRSLYCVQVNLQNMQQQKTHDKHPLPLPLAERTTYVNTILPNNLKIQLTSKKYAKDKGL